MATVEQISNSEKFYNTHSILNSKRIYFYKEIEYKENWYKTTGVLYIRGTGFLFRTVNTCIENEFDGSSEINLSEFLVTNESIEKLVETLNTLNIKPVQDLNKESQEFIFFVSKIFKRTFIYEKLLPEEIKIREYLMDDPIKETLCLLLSYFENSENDVLTLKQHLLAHEVKIIDFGTEYGG